MELVPNLPDDIIHECFVRIHHNMISTIAALSKGWKKKVQSLLFYNRRKADGLTRSIVVLPSSINRRPDRKNLHSTFIFHDLETCLTTNLPPIPGFSKKLFESSHCVGVGQNLVVMIRENGTNSSIDPFNAVFVYNFWYAKWRRGADMPGEARSGFAFVSDFNRMVFVVGGHEIETNNALRCAMAYDVLEDKWFSLPDMHTEKFDCTGTFLLGKLYITNQWISEDELVRRESFDIATGQWEQKEHLLEEDRWKFTHLVSYKRKMYRCSDGNIAVLEGDKWQNIAILPDLHELCTAQLVVASKGNLFVSGYSVFCNHYSIYMLDLENYKWTKLKVPTDYRWVHNAICCLEI